MTEVLVLYYSGVGNTKRVADIITKLENSVPTYVFTTCGLYLANSLRIFGQRSVVKNMASIISRIL